MTLRLLSTTALLAAALCVPALAQTAPASPPPAQSFPANPSLSDNNPGNDGSEMDGPDGGDDEMDNAAAPPAGASTERARPNRQARDPVERVRKQFARMDRNNDGAVDDGEMERMRLRSFNRYDTTRDGQLDSNELNAANAVRKARMQEKAEASGRTIRDRQLNRDPLRKADSNNDGVLTKDEYLANPRRMMQRADTDRDGKVSQAELEAAISRRASK